MGKLSQVILRLYAPFLVVESTKKTNANKKQRTCFAPLFLLIFCVFSLAATCICEKQTKTKQNKTKQQLVILFECGGFESLSMNQNATHFIGHKRWMIAFLILFSGGFQPSLSLMSVVFCCF